MLKISIIDISCVVILYSYQYVNLTYTPQACFIYPGVTIKDVGKMTYDKQQQQKLMALHKTAVTPLH